MSRDINIHASLRRIPNMGQFRPHGAACLSAVVYQIAQNRTSGTSEPSPHSARAADRLRNRCCQRIGQELVRHLARGGWEIVLAVGVLSPQTTFRVE